ncbi:type III-B CRISPR module RAMP protein Cmr4 [Thermodesulfobacteriota bacterium B35]
MEMRLYTLRTRSGLHCGIGQGLSDIDLPTAREPVTGYPLVPSSSLKGVLRDRFDNGSDEFYASFGQDGSKSSLDFAAALSFTDARLVCLPVRSYFGTFAYLASPFSLQILAELIQQKNHEKSLPDLPAYPAPGETDSYRASVPDISKLVSRAAGGKLASRLLLEDLDLLIDEDSGDLAKGWADEISMMIYPDERNKKSRQLFVERFAIVDDNVLAFFCETSLPVAAHNRIGSNGIVARGALWYEEYVPPEAIFVGAVFGEQGRGKGNRKFSASDLLGFVCAEPLNCQVGGSATTGRGLVSIHFQ